MLLNRLAGIVLSVCCVAGAACAETPTPGDARVYIISPANGEAVHSPVTVKFGLQGMGVAPAGVDRPGTGHHHLLIDVPGRPALDKPLPADERHRHFGGGQTQATIELPPGKHTLQLIMGDMHHIPHRPAIISEKITITVY